jgi:ribosome-associated protein
MEAVSVTIPEDELFWSFARSGGPGGQNVNKVSSKALLRWNICATTAFSFEAKARLLEQLGKRITKEGDLLIASQRYRDQARNMEDCRNKLRALLAQALRTVKVRKKTRPTKSSQQRRLTAKKKRSLRKQQRRGRHED